MNSKGLPYQPRDKLEIFQYHILTYNLTDTMYGWNNLVKICNPEQAVYTKDKWEIESSLQLWGFGQTNVIYYGCQ